MPRLGRWRSSAFCSPTISAGRSTRCWSRVSWSAVSCRVSAARFTRNFATTSAVSRSASPWPIICCRPCGKLPHGRQQIIGQGDAERLTALVVAKFLVKRAAETLHETADQLTLDQHRVDRPADIVGEQKALDRHLPSLGINADDADLHAVRVSHM